MYACLFPFACVVTVTVDSVDTLLNAIKEGVMIVGVLTLIRFIHLTYLVLS
jgi:hypothetical protein